MVVSTGTIIARNELTTLDIWDMCKTGEQDVYAIACWEGLSIVKDTKVLSTHLQGTSITCISYIKDKQVLLDIDG